MTGEDILQEAGRTVRERRGDTQSDTRFSETEYQRRFDRVRKEMEANGIDCLLIYGNSSHSGSGQQSIRYLSAYNEQIASYIVFPLEGEPTLFVTLSAQPPDAYMISNFDDIRVGGHAMVDGIVERITELGCTDGVVGLVGSIGPTHHLPTEDYLGLQRELPDAEFQFHDDLMDRVSLKKSEEEIQALTEGARLTDRAMEALEDAVEPGVTERELKAALISSYLADGEYMFELLGATSMKDPDMAVPWEHQSNYAVGADDIVLTEISGKNPQGYSGQILRSIAVGEIQNGYREMHEAAEEVFHGVMDVLEPGATTEDVVGAATPAIEDRGFTHQIPILHGWGMGIQHPVMGTRNSMYAERGANEPFEFEAGHTVVIEPNPITPDRLKGVVFGELVHITSSGAERIHDYPLEFIQK